MFHEAATRGWDEDELRQLARMWADESGNAELKGGVSLADLLPRALLGCDPTSASTEPKRPASRRTRPARETLARSDDPPFVFRLCA
jgi:hypothetical protein